MSLLYTNDNTYFENILDKELIFIKNSLSLQKKGKSTILIYIKQLTEYIDIIPISFSNPQHLTNTLTMLKDALDHIDLSTEYLNQLITNLTSLKKVILEKREEKVKLYNQDFFNLYTKIYENDGKVQNCITYIAENYSLCYKEETLQPEEQLINILSPMDIQEESPDNNVLIISEKEQKAFLPYKYNDIQKLLKQNSNYTSIEDVIADCYTVSLNEFKNSSISRFKEGFRLMRKDFNGIQESFALALELLFKDNLNPIIIRACRNTDELDIFLDCLEENEIDKFNVFDIKYEITPIKI
jgi:hypothetical protein